MTNFFIGFGVGIVFVPIVLFISIFITGWIENGGR